MSSPWIWLYPHSKSDLNLTFIIIWTWKLPLRCALLCPLSFTWDLIIYYYLLIIYQVCGMNLKYTSTVINWVILCQLFDLQKLKRLNVGNILAFLNFDRLAFSCDLKVWAENKYLENWAALITLLDMHYVHTWVNINILILSYLNFPILSNLLKSYQIILWVKIICLFLFWCFWRWLIE